MATFKLPQNELSKLRRYKKKLLEQQRELDRGEFSEDTSVHEAIVKSQGIDQILETLEPKGVQTGTDFKGAISTAEGQELPLSEPVYEKAEPTRQSFVDVFKIASEYDISTKGLKQPKPLTKKDLKSQNFIEKWGIEYDPNLDEEANITAGLEQVFPHEREQYMKESEALFAKPKKVSEKTKALDIIRTQKIKQYHEENNMAYDDNLDYAENIQDIANNLSGQAQIKYMDDIEGLVKDKEDKATKPRLTEQRARNKLNSAVIKINKLKGKITEGLNKSGDEEELAFISRKFNEWLEFIPEEAREEYLQDIGEGVASAGISREDAITELKRRGRM